LLGRQRLTRGRRFDPFYAHIFTRPTIPMNARMAEFGMPVWRSQNPPFASCSGTVARSDPLIRTTNTIGTRLVPITSGHGHGPSPNGACRDRRRLRDCIPWCGHYSSTECRRSRGSWQSPLAGPTTDSPTIQANSSTRCRLRPQTGECRRKPTRPSCVERSQFACRARLHVGSLASLR